MQNEHLVVGGKFQGERIHGSAREMTRADFEIVHTKFFNAAADDYRRQGYLKNLGIVLQVDDNGESGIGQVVKFHESISKLGKRDGTKLNEEYKQHMLELKTVDFVATVCECDEWNSTSLPGPSDRYLVFHLQSKTSSAFSFCKVSKFFEKNDCIKPGPLEFCDELNNFAMS